MAFETDLMTDPTVDENSPSTPEDEHRSPVQVVLVPGFWLGGWAWDEVCPRLEAAGLTPHPVTLPGLDPNDDPAGIGQITRDDHIAAVRSLIDGLEGNIVLVGHSGGGPVIQEVADRDPQRISRMIFVDAGPLVDGATLSPPIDADSIGLPSWAELTEQGSSLEGIDDAGLERFRSRALPQPAAVASGGISISNPGRLRVPVTAICSSIPAQTLREIAAPDGPLHAELLDYDVTWVDLPTGHWPMFSEPEKLSAAIAAAVRRSPSRPVG